jgi:hypothetical protein
MTHDAASAMGVCHAFVARAPVDGAAFTAMVSDVSRDLLCASDAVIAAVEDLQFGDVNPTWPRRDGLYWLHRSERGERVLGGMTWCRSR